MRYWSVLLLIFVTNLWAANPKTLPPMAKVNQSLNFQDDLDFENMQLAIERQLKSFARLDMKAKIKLGAETYERKVLKDGLEHFLILTTKLQNCLKNSNEDACYDDFSRQVNQQFHIYRPLPLSSEQGYATGQTLFTAYYSPDLHASRTKTQVYKNPIYKMPKDPKLKGLSRVEIDFDNKLAGKGLEIFYVKESLFDIWLLHVEGGGRVHVENPDGSVDIVYLSYAGANGLSFKMLYHYMLEQNMVQPGKASIADQRAYLEANPADQRRVFATCPSYIFFYESLKEPVGVQNIILTENRSLATDYRIYKEYGLLNFIQAKRPFREDGVVKMKNFSRFFINQDTGGAIRGNARSDLYFGFGPEAELTANTLKLLGNQYFLIKK
jgi:membrane-bound lytic murein transglycosylase A